LSSLENGKVCTKCLVWKEDKQYSQKNATGRKRAFQSRCKTCSIEDSVLWREKQSPERLKDLYYKRTYNLSLNQFTTLLAQQEGLCAICKRQLVLENLTGDSAVVDHCHVSGKVRGILCNECNRGLGYFRDKISSLLSAATYLKEH
jgi:Recombination endonuclease VII